jgi:hypothetical protein
LNVQLPTLNVERGEAQRSQRVDGKKMEDGDPNTKRPTPNVKCGLKPKVNHKGQFNRRDAKSAEKN